MKNKPNYIETVNENEVCLHAMKNGSKRLDRFSSKRGLYKVGDSFTYLNQTYVIKKITYIKDDRTDGDAE